MVEEVVVVKFNNDEYRIDDAKVVVVVVVGEAIDTEQENAFVLLPNWRVIVPELLALTVHNSDVDEPELMSMFADVWSPVHVIPEGHVRE